MSNIEKISSGGFSRLLFVHCLSSMHCGTGQGIGVIDLPIAREGGTGLPYIPGSSLKGNLRAAALGAGMPEDERLAAFGPEKDHADEHAGALTFGDARLVALPARSLGGTFAWATTPYLLNRLARDAMAAGLEPPPAVPAIPVNTALVVEPGTLGVGDQRSHVVLDELELPLEANERATSWAQWIAGCLWPDGTPDAGVWKDHFRKRFAMLPEEDFQFLCEHGTEVVARVAIDSDKGTVARGALWYEERLPAESILVSIAFGRASRRAQKKATGEELMRMVFDKPSFRQFGGKLNVGRGFCRLIPAVAV